MKDPIKFYMDENVPTAVAKGLRRRGVDVVTTTEANLLGASDDEQLRFAVNQKRVVFTKDDDFLRLHAAGMKHAGIVYAPLHTPIGEIVRGLMLIYQVLEASEMQNHVEFL